MATSNYDNEDSDIVITLDIDGVDVDYEVLTIFEVNDQDYVALYPSDEGPNPEDIDIDHILLYPYFEDGTDYYIDDFSSEEEYEQVEDYFYRMLQEAEF